MEHKITNPQLTVELLSEILINSGKSLEELGFNYENFSKEELNKIIEEIVRIYTGEIKNGIHNN